MAAPNIVNVTTITGITTFIAGINTGGDGVNITKNPAGVTTIVSNAASSGKVLKINSLVAAGVGATTGVTVDIYDKATATGAANTVSIASTIAVPTFSSVVIIGKENAIYRRRPVPWSLCSTRFWKYQRSCCIRKNWLRRIRMGYLGRRIGLSKDKEMVIQRVQMVL